MNKIKEDAINLHRALRGKIEIHNRVSIDAGFGEEKGTLGLIYTPGVASVAEEISKNKELVYDAHILRMFQPSLKLTYSLYLCVQSCCISC